jgi:7-cyano-7-deazaguanosine (preQ0) biosynthesis protein QueE
MLWAASLMLLARMPNGAPEVFATVQGEGASLGVPSVFVRLAGCNLHCGFCDTAYTWDWSRFDKKKETEELSVDAVAARAYEVAKEGVRNVVFTGGEPLLQQKELAVLATQMKERGFRVEIETNGTVVPEPALAAAVDQWNVSPKLASSGNPLDKRYEPNALAWFADRANAFFKVVLVSKDDLAEIERLGFPKERVILMPEGTDPTTLAERSRWLAELCTEKGYRLGARLHVHIWGAERGR